MAKKLFYVCAGLLMLAVAYQLGAGRANAQAPGNPVVGISETNTGNGGVVVMTANGDSYASLDAGVTWHIRNNCFNGTAPTQTSTESFGALKVKYR